ncbi:MAG: hypothetical protein IJ017_08425 [Oscillospiraceae bacterium]|nr:hypothetical protein [Oscillospiraceae bacterium]
MSKNKKEEKLSISKKAILAQLIVMWAGVVLCLIGMFAPEFEILGYSSRVISLPGGILALVGVFVMLFANKCPYCGMHKVGRNIGGTLKKEIECPDCKKKIDIK